MTVYQQLIKACKESEKKYFSTKELKKLVIDKFGDNGQDIMPPDYCYNRINDGIPFTKHIFVFIEEKYKFIGENDLYSGAIIHRPQNDKKKEMVVGLWESGTFYLWEDFPKVSKKHPKRTPFMALTTHELTLSAQVIESSQDNASVREARLKVATKIPAKVAVVTYAYVRNPDVIAEVLFRASGYCQKCSKQAPFSRRKDKMPYLEVHHKKQLANGGEDSVENAIALCPNCHRELHFG